MPQSLRRLAVCFALVLAAAAPGFAGEHHLGFGLHYWKAVSDLTEGFDEDGLAAVGSYQYYPAGLLGFEFDLEYFDTGFAGSTSAVYSPQAYVLFGKALYAGVGIGSNYSSGFADNFSDPFFAAKAGLVVPLLPRIHLDLNANYRFDDWSELGDASSDTVTLGAAVRLYF